MAISKKQHVLVGRRIAKLRFEKKWTQEFLCGVLQIDRRSLQRIESGEWNMTIDYLARFKKAFRCKWSDLLED